MAKKGKRSMKNGGFGRLAAAALAAAAVIIMSPVFLVAIIFSGSAKAAAEEFNKHPSCEGNPDFGTVDIPEHAKDWVNEASANSGLPRDFLAALMSEQSDFSPSAEGTKGGETTYGLFQLTMKEWYSYDSRAQILPPANSGIYDSMQHARDGGKYLKRRLEEVRQLKTENPEAAYNIIPDLDALIILYAGEPGNSFMKSELDTFPDLEPKTQSLLQAVRRLTGRDAQTGACLAVSGKLEKTLVYEADGSTVDFRAMGVPYTDYGGETGYPAGQCTWWAAWRRESIGRPVDAHLGNGRDWADSAARLGMSVDSLPRVGDVVCFQGAVLGADAVYGHVAVIEEISDGTVIISESNVKGLGIVTTRSLALSQLEEFAGSGVKFIH